MGYELGVDLGTTYTAAAVRYDGRVEVVQLGTRRAEIPSLVFVKVGGVVLVGEAAERRGALDPSSLAKEFKRRVGDRVPMQVGGQPFAAQALMGLLLDDVLATVSRQQEGLPDVLSITCPANWGPYRRGLLEEAVRDSARVSVELHVEPEAAAIQFASGERVQPGEVVAVYDLGGGTFDAAVLQKTESGFALLGEPAGVEELGGIDFDEAVLGHVVENLGPAIAELDQADPLVLEALVRLRRECVEAKEALSSDTDVTIPVSLPSIHTRIRLTRSEFEEMVGPSLTETVHAMDRALQSAQVAPESLRAILLTGGSSRIPLVSELLSERYARPLVMDPQPEHSIALGAARAARPELGSGTAQSGGGPPAPPVDGTAFGGGADPSGRAKATLPGTGRKPGVRGWLVAGTAAVAVLLVIGVVWYVARNDDEKEPSGQPSNGSTAGLGSWRRLADLPVELEAAAVAEYQNQLWVAGGLQDDADSSKLGLVWAYDPETDGWTPKATLPIEVSHGALVKLNDNLYFLGGWIQDGASDRVFKLSDDGTTWTDDVPLPKPRIGGAAAFNGSTIVYAGGTQNNIARGTVWERRAAGWADIGRLSKPRAKAAVITNKRDTVWVLGGRRQFPDVKRFGNIDVIAHGGVSPYEQASVDPAVDSGVGVLLDGVKCVLGGEIDAGYNDWWCEEPGAAEDLPKLDPPRAGLGAAWIGDTLYVVGGYNTSTLVSGGAFRGTSLLEAYTPDD